MAPLAGLVGARLAGSNHWAVVAAANAGTPFVYLPAYGVAAAAAMTGQRRLFAVASAVAVAHIVWTAPELQRRRPLPPEAEGRPRLRVVTSNVRFTSRDSLPLGRELAGWRADVLFVQELTRDHLVMLKEAGTLDPFPYSVVDTRPGSFGSGIWSRHRLSDGESWDVGGVPGTRATLHVDGTEIRLCNVHTKAPSRSSWVKAWTQQLDNLGAQVEGDPRPIILAGDFNATNGQPQFRRLLASAGLRDAHNDVGRGLAATWPSHFPLIPAFFRLDHVLVSDGLAVAGVREGAGKTSDHRPVIADLVVLGGATGERAGPRTRS